jgi:hypothetical protein
VACDNSCNKADPFEQEKGREYSDHQHYQAHYSHVSQIVVKGRLEAVDTNMDKGCRRNFHCETALFSRMITKEPDKKGDKCAELALESWCISGAYREGGIRSRGDDYCRLTSASSLYRA